MKKAILILFAIIGFSSLTIGQSNKVFTAFGQTYIADYIATTPSETTFKSDNTYGSPVEADVVTQYKAISYATYMYRIRYNLTEMSDESAISAFITPTVGFSANLNDNYGAYKGFGYLGLPIGISFEKGAGSTYNSSAEAGFSFKLGVEILFAPVIQTKTYLEVYDPTSGYMETVEGTFKGLGASILPTASIGFRYWNKNNVMKEIQIQAGYGGKGKSEGLSNESEYSSGMHLQVSFFKILNY